MNADRSSRDSDRETAELTGNVHVIYGDQHMVADHALVNLRSKTVDAVGDVVVTTPSATIVGKHIIFEFETNTAVIYEGFVQSGPVFFEGKVVYKLGEKEYLAEEGKYTTCTNCPESWRFSGTKIRAILGGYAYIKNSLFEFGGLPFFWLPYLVVPLKSDRQSGFLTPEFEHSAAGGFGVSESYFWAMTQDQDSTFTFKNYELRGAKALYQYRYAISEHGYAELNSGYLQDAAFARDPRFQTFLPSGSHPDSVQRWFFRYNQYQELPENFVDRVQINAINDLQYPKDFPIETSNSEDAAAEDRVTISHSNENFHWMVDSSYYTNLLQSNPLAGNNDSVHRMPEIRLDETEVPILGSKYTANWSVDYTNFTRNGFGWDTLNAPYASGGSRYLANSGSSSNCNTTAWEQDPACSAAHSSTYSGSTDPLQNRDLLRTGTRLDSQLEVARPLRISNFDIVPSANVRETDYEFQSIQQSTAVREYAQSKITGRTNFSDIYTFPDSKVKVKHVIQPELTYQYIFWFNQTRHPFFGANGLNSPFNASNPVTDGDLNSPYGLQFDYEDRTYFSKIVTLSLANFLIRKSWVKDEPAYSQFLTWRLSQSYDVAQSEGNSPNHPWGDIVSDFSIGYGRYSFQQYTDYYPYQQVYNSRTSIRITNNLDFMQLSYYWNNPVTPGNPVLYDNRTEQVTLTAKKALKYLDLLGRVIYDENAAADGGQPVNSYGIATQFRLPGECWYFYFMIYRPPAGLENIAYTFNFSFDGTRRPSMSEGTLDTFTFQ